MKQTIAVTVVLLFSAACEMEEPSIDDAPPPIGGKADGDEIPSASPEKLGGALYQDRYSAGVAVDDAYVYWATGDYVERVSKSEADVSRGQYGRGSRISAVAENSTTLFWINYGQGSPHAQDKTSGTAHSVLVNPLYGWIVQDGRAHGLVADEEYVYWINDNGGYLECRVYRVPATGAPTATLLGTFQGGCGDAMAHDEDNIYFVANRRLVRLGKDDGTMTVLVSGLWPNAFLAIDDEWAYISSGTNVYSVAKQGGSFAQLTAERMPTEDDSWTSSLDVRFLAVDDNHIYWFTRGDFLNDGNGDLRYMSKDGTGSPKILADDLYEPRSLTSNGGYLYWSAIRQNPYGSYDAWMDVYRVPKPVIAP